MTSSDTLDIQKIVEAVSASRKYRDVYRPTVERIVRATQESGPEKEWETRAKATLHQIWGAYWETRPDFEKLLGRLEADLRSPATHEEALRTLMRLHASTNERSTILPDFWKRIWEVTGAPGSIIDHGCGFMPLSFPWMSLPEGTTYRGVDIDTAQSRFLNAVLQTSGAPPQVQVEDGDVLTDIYPSVDVVCMLKLLPLLERQVGIDGVRETVARQECHRLVVSYPVASIGGREKGMPDFYRASFAALMRQLGRKYVEIPFPDELVFVAGK